MIIGIIINIIGIIVIFTFTSASTTTTTIIISNTFVITANTMKANNNDDTNVDAMTVIIIANHDQDYHSRYHEDDRYGCKDYDFDC